MNNQELEKIVDVCNKAYKKQRRRSYLEQGAGILLNLAAVATYVLFKEQLLYSQDGILHQLNNGLVVLGTGLLVKGAMGMNKVNKLCEYDKQKIQAFD